MNQSKRLQLTTLFLLLPFLFSACQSAPAATPVAPDAPDSGFRPGSDGFPFRNYGRKDNVTNLTPAEMRDVYGELVCSNPEGDCVLTPPAQAQMDRLNDIMNGGAGNDVLDGDDDTDTLNGAESDELAGALRQPARQRGQGEDRQAGEEHPPASVTVNRTTKSPASAYA